MQRILLAGAVGSGKGTMAKKILEHFDNFSIFCAGDVIRAQINSGTDFGKRARSFLEAGEHIPEAIVNDFLIEEISKKAAYSRLVLDGFPRSISQLAAVEKIAPVSLCIELEVPRKVIFERLAKRLVHGDSGRTYNQDYNPSHLEGKDDVTGENLMRRVDDTEEAIRRRLEVYAKTESKVAAYYKSCGVGVTIKGDSSDVIWPVVREHIEELLEVKKVASSA